MVSEGRKIMSKTKTKATFYLDSELYKAFRVKATLADKKISELMNQTLRNEISEDEEDLKILRRRADGTTETYAEFLKGLKADGLI